MSPKLLRFNARQIIKIIEAKGFSLSRQSGSHMIFYNKKGVRITIPKHTSKIIHPKILKNILRDAEIEEGDL
ncbi:MAG: type II toxin-antitoxin system HicA family toxin [Candidatus Nomurabacteria bacterium]|nr:type II toxin-antitoxin system HicA family toxin [Candidatus Nomurabacteria bacterium]